MLTLTLLIGLWSTTCIQTQTSERSGYVIESYQIESRGDFIFQRKWFKDVSCSTIVAVDASEGTLSLGSKISTTFGPDDVYQADFTTKLGNDLGAVSVARGTLKIARGMPRSTFRNTMLSLFEFKKQ